MKRVRKTVVLAIITLTIGCKLSIMATGAIELFFVIAFMGFPSGWRFIGKRIGYTFLFSCLPVRAFGFCIKIALSFAVGWIVLVLDLFLCIIELCSGKEMI